MIGRLIEWCINNRLFTCILYIAITLVGVWAIYNTPLDALPELSDTQVIISTEWMGHDPETVEDQVTYPITTAMLSLPGVKDVRGFSYFGQSFVYVIFEDGVDLYWARSRVLEHLSGLKKELPEDVTPSLGPDATGLGWVFIYTVEDRGGRVDLSELRALQDFYIRYQLMSVPGVAEVATVGGVEKEYQVVVEPERLEYYRISTGDVISAIKNNNRDFGGGVMEVSGAEFMIRGRAYIKGIEDIEGIVVKTEGDGTPVLLKDIGVVTVAPSIKRGIADRDGVGEVVAGIVVARYGADVPGVITEVKEKLKEISGGLPEGVVIKPVYDRSELIDRATHTLKKKLLEEIAIVTLVVFVFLLHVRSSLTACVTLPVGVLIAFILMHALGMSANIMSLSGIAIAIGAMVDAAVVLVENTHKHIEREGGNVGGAKRIGLVLRASKEVGPALFFSLLIITVSFLPVFALKDEAGRLFKPLAWTKTFSMAGSALVSVTLVPVLISLFVRGRIRAERDNPASRVLMRLYMPVIKWVLRYPKTVVICAVVITALTYIPYSRIGGEFMPPLKEGDILYMPTTIPGLSSGEAGRVLQIQDRLLKRFPEVEVVLGKIGRATTPTDPAPLNMVETHVILRPEENWPERIIEEGYIEGLAEGVLKGLKEKGVLKKDISVQDVAEGVEDKVRWKINSWIREELVRGRSMEDIKRKLPQRLKEGIGKELEARGIGDAGRRDTLKGIVSGLHIHVAGIPLRRESFEELTKVEMDRLLKVPGMPNWWLMPIETRLGMLTTGMKGLLGLKVRGDAPRELERIALEVEAILRDVPGTLSVSSERAMGGNYLDIVPDRRALSRYGLSVKDIETLMEHVIGGRPVTETIEGRRRYAVTIRYPQELRDDPEKLKRVLISTPEGGFIPLSHVAGVEMHDGSPVIKSEKGMLLVDVPVELERGVDIKGYVERAQQAIDEAIEGGRLKLPSGYYMEWSGQFEMMEKVRKTLTFIVPLTVALVFVLLYLNFGRLTETLIIMLSLPFSLVGGVWLMCLLGYKMSVATAVGFIALMGLAAETGVVMLIYLELACKRRRERGELKGWAELKDAMIEGAVMRIRPKVMVVSCLILGLLPVMWSTEVGTRAMQRMVAPMIGGLVSSTLLTLIVIPAVYVMVRRRKIS